MEMLHALFDNYAILFNSALPGMLLIIPQYSSLVNEEESSCFLPVLLPRSVFFS